MKKKFFSGVFALALVVIAGYGVNRSMYSNANLSDLALKNVIAFAEIENPDPGEGGGDEFKCKIKKDPCKIRLTFDLINILFTKFNMTGLIIGMELDLTDMTKLYVLGTVGDPNNVRCGTDVTCSDLKAPPPPPPAS